LERVRSLTADLQQMLHGLATAAPDGGNAAAGAPGGGQSGVQGADDVIDADYSPAG
jgi:molecular chaperone DnaK